jgi:hypothetical protein
VRNLKKWESEDIANEGFREMNEKRSFGWMNCKSYSGGKWNGIWIFLLEDRFGGTEIDD